MRSCACPTCTLNCPRQVFHFSLARGETSKGDAKGPGHRESSTRLGFPSPQGTQKYFANLDHGGSYGRSLAARLADSNCSRGALALRGEDDAISEQGTAASSVCCFSLVRR